MDLLQMKYFATVAQTGNVTRAAELLNIAQPSLSATIARLENDLGVPLFDRRGRRIVLNQFGKSFLQRVRHGEAPPSWPKKHHNQPIQRPLQAFRE